MPQIFEMNEGFGPCRFFPKQKAPPQGIVDGYIASVSSSVYCEMTISEVLLMVRLLLGMNGTLNGKVYVTFTWTISPWKL